MNNLKPFSIVFTGLKTGNHQFEFIVDKSFFDEFDYSPVKMGDLNVDLAFNKQENMFVLEFIINGIVRLTCDRCNDEFDLPVHTNEKLIFKIGEEEFTNSDDVIVLSNHEHQINVASYIYEFIILSVPLIHIHPDLNNSESGCNKEALAILKRLSKEETNNSPEVIEDPRWEALKKLRGN